MQSIAAYIFAAIAEIAGCFAFWAWFRLDKCVLAGAGDAVVDGQRPDLFAGRRDEFLGDREMILDLRTTRRPRQPKQQSKTKSTINH